MQRARHRRVEPLRATRLEKLLLVVLVGGPFYCSSISDNGMALREFQRSDNLIIESWFRDLGMQKWLESPWTEQELDEIEKDEYARLFVIEDNGKVVALIGCYFPGRDVREYTITVLAVDSEERGKGYAKTAIAALLNMYGRGNAWQAYCEPENVAACNLFASTGWKVENQEPNSQNFLTYRIET